MPVKETSIQAYREHLLSGAARTQRDKIYLAMVKISYPVNRNTICDLTHLRINAVTGRVHELLQRGFIKVHHKAVDPIGPAKTPVEYLSVVHPDDMTGEDYVQLGLLVAQK